MRCRLPILLLFAFICVHSRLSLPASAQEGELTVFPAQVEGVAPSGMMDAYLKRLLTAALEKREKEYEQAKTPEQLAAYRERRRKFFLDRLGPLPEKTPLNAKVTGRLDRDGYRIEKLIYESQPGFHVTAVLYLPDSKPPHPAVLVPCGHSENGKAADPYQRACILLAKNGLAALCFDPVGQGERKQVLDEAGKGKFRPTAEHAVEAPGSILVGRNVATYMVWDGMRSIDYLLSRRDIDGARIGCAGNSGGGTQTAYLMALDERIAAAAPNCYITSFRRLLETIGPQDPEQNIFGQLEAGMDHADYLLLRAPKPTMIGAATRDFFDIGGTWDTYRQAKRFYTRLGFPERVDLVETDAEHGFSKEIRTATVQWMRRWLLEKDGPVTEPDLAVLTDAELQSTPRGQVVHLEGERTLFDLNRELADRLAAERKRLWAEPVTALHEVRKLAGIPFPTEPPPGEVRALGTVQRDGYRIDRLALPMEAGITLPALAFVPGELKGEPYLYLDGRGKQTDAGPGGPIERLARAGSYVLAVDLRGLGEMQGRDREGRPSGTSGRDVETAYLLGRSYVGMRAEDVVRCSLYLRQGKLAGAGSPASIHIVAIGEAALPALHAAALHPDRIASLKLVRPLRSWVEAAGKPEPPLGRANVVHGALKAYDVPDLVRLLGGKASEE